MTAVTDTSVVLNLCWLGLDSLLARFFERVLAPVDVRDEFERSIARPNCHTGLGVNR